MQLIRAKEIERRLGVARMAASKQRREAKAIERATSDWTVAAQAITDLEAVGGELAKLTNAQLAALVRVLKLGNGQGKKAALVAALAARVSNASRETLAALRASIERGAAASDLALALPAPRAALPNPEPDSRVAANPPAAATVEPLPLARRRQRRNA